MSIENMSVIAVVVGHNHEAFSNICEWGCYFGTKDERFVFLLPRDLYVNELGLTGLYGRSLHIKDHKLRVLIVELNESEHFVFRGQPTKIQDTPLRLIPPVDLHRRY